MLAMKADTIIITVSPDRPNIRYTVKFVDKGKEMEQLNWIVNIAKEFGTLMPKTIIFYNTYTEIATVLSYILKVLGTAAYIPKNEKCPSNRIVAIYHSTTWKKYKDRVVKSFKHDIGNARILLASSALGMGVNFPDVHYVIHFGPARSIIDHVQQAGRAGRDGKPAHNVVISTGHKLAHCETAVKEFVRSNTCLRKALLQSLDKSVANVEPLHLCCSNCSKLCKCNGENCSGEKFPFEYSTPCIIQTQQQKRVVCTEDRAVLEEALKEYQNSLSECSRSPALPALGFYPKILGFFEAVGIFLGFYFEK
jgi:superfamily II DNA helicase RecQ